MYLCSWDLKHFWNTYFLQQYWLIHADKGMNVRIHWKHSTILEASNKSVWSNGFWYVKVGIVWNFVQYNIHWDKTNLQKNPFRQNKRYKKCPHFFFRSSFVFNLRFLHELKHKVRVSKAVWGIFHFRICFVLIKVYIFDKQNAWTLWL